MPRMVKLEAGHVVDALWRCRRGHEEPARVHDSAVDRESTVSIWPFVFMWEDGTKTVICPRCLAEDYGCELVEFGKG